MLPSPRKSLGSVPWRLGGEEEQLRGPGARRAGRKGFDYPPGQALCGAQHRRSPRRGRQARVRARARVRPRRAWARLSCGDCAAPPAAPASLLSALLGDALQRRPPALWLNKSISQTNLARQGPAAAVGRGPSGSIPAPPVPAGPAPASPGAPARASQSLCAPLALPSSPSPFLPHVLLCFPRSGAVRVAEETEPFRRKFGPWSTPVPGHRWARLQPVPPSPQRSPRRLPARPLPLPLPPSPRRSRGSLLHADPGRRWRWRRRALRQDAGTRASLLSGSCSTSIPSAGALKSFVPLRLD